MTPIANNQDVACFFVTKHSWKGKYKRVFSVGSLGISTYNPEKLEVTNKWEYDDIISVLPSSKGTTPTALQSEFIMTMRKDRTKTDSMKFSSDHRAEVLTEALRYKHRALDKTRDRQVFQAYKHHWSDTRLPVTLEVTPCSLDQLDPTNNKVLASYYYKDMEGILTMSDYTDGFTIAYGGFGRLHLFSSYQIHNIIKKIAENALTNIGLTINILKDKITLDDFLAQRFGIYSDDEHLTSVSEFPVHKVSSSRHLEPQRRTLCLSETCLLERDQQTYSICTLRPLKHVFALIRDSDNPQLFRIEYLNGDVRTYTSSDRDSLLASLLDGVRASGNRDVHVKMCPTPRGKRFGPLSVRVDEETESYHLKFLQQLPVKRSFHEMVERFNANIPYSGLLYSVTQEGFFADNKEKLINGALQSLVQKEGDQTTISNYQLESQFQALRRLVASKIGFAAFTSMPGFREAIGNKVVSALRRNDQAVTHAAIDMICALMHPMHDNYDLRQEQMNKSSLLMSEKFLDSLLNMWITHVTHGTGALIVSAMLDFLTFALCVPYSETTNGEHFDNLLEMVAARGRFLFKLFEHPSMAIVKGAGLVMRAVIEEGEADVAARMQNMALAEGALPRHLLTSLFTSGTDGRQLTNRQLSRHLVGLWVTGHPTALGLLKRIMPTGLLSFLDSDEQIPTTALEQELLNNRDNLKIAQDHSSKLKRGPNWVAVERKVKAAEKYIEHYTQRAVQHWGARVGIVVERKEKIKERPITLRKRRERIKAESNWKLFYWKFNQDHMLPNLIWNHKTREELRNALDNEIRAFASDRELAGGALIAWNHQEFELHYQCLADEIRIGDYYLRLLLENENLESPIRKSYEFFNDLYHRFLLTGKTEMKCICLQAMTIVYGKYYEDIGPFSDSKFIINMLDKSIDRAERDRLVMFIHKLILNRRNVKDIMEANGVRILVNLLTLAHLHTSRAVVPAQTNVIEAGPGMEGTEISEWHYQDEGDSKPKGPLSINEIKEKWSRNEITQATKCWASGMETWRAIKVVPQLKWTLVARGSSVLNETDLATLILNILIQMCQYFPSRDADDAIIRPLPRVKRLLSDHLLLSHVVQLLLTFDPTLVEKVALLLCEVMQDNPEVSKLYQTGVFFFILMYTGSNVLPIAKFLQLTHMKQATRSEENVTSDIMQRSVLGQLLPEAMVYYLENHGADKFAQIFLGEYDTPEAIWSTEMRRLLIEKVALHISDFSPKLRCNIMARYQYLAIPAVRYPQLEKELFCNIYYLRHLCDATKFPDWPISNPVKLLKDVLETWKNEVEKKPPAMTVDEAYKNLDLPSGEHHDEATVRKAYYRLAQKFHPDKNPEGRDRFEQVNQAYDFLCSRSCWNTDGPNPDNIVLVLKTQSILFERYSEELQPYKYAGYPQLIKTIQLETADERLFSKSAPLLAAASELAYYTVHCSALNAEELRREKGLEVLLEAYSRCVSVLSNSSKPTEVSVQVCQHITRCYNVAAQFPACRDRMVELPQLVKDLCRILYFKHLTKLCTVASECVSALAVEGILQMQLLKSGALWHLLLYMFNYDFTLEEGGVERSEDSNQQEVSNRLAKLAVKACARLGGYLPGDLATPSNQVAVSTLESLLTPFLANQLSQDKPVEILKTLNSNSETPYLIWDNGTRAELCDFLEMQRQSRQDQDGVTGDMERAVQFSYSAHEGELVVGGIYIRIYNQQPTFPIEDPKKFAVDLLNFLTEQKQHLCSIANIGYSVTIKDRIRYSTMILEALKNIIKNNPGVESVCIGHFQLLFGLLGVVQCPDIQKGALEVISTVSRNHDCVNDIAANQVLVPLLLLLYILPDHQTTILETLQALLTTTSIVKEAFNKGAVIYLLDLFCNSNSLQVRQTSAELLSRMCADKLIGPRIRLAIVYFLPPVFVDAMRDNTEACIHMFESQQEHPELIWDDDSRRRVSELVADLRGKFQTAQMDNPSAVWKMPDTSGGASSPAATPDEVVVGGVYLRLFIVNPGWTLRKPKEFLSELLDTCIQYMAKDKPDSEYLEMVTKALCALLQAQPTLADHIPALGHIPRICTQMAVQNNPLAVPKAAILVLHQLALSEVCITAISQTECMQPLKHAMQVRKDMVGVACETLHRLFSTNQELLVKQALEADFVSYLLTLLEGRLELLENPAMTKAQIVKALKAMSRSTMFGERVNVILEKSTVWAEYKDQRHDLFISSTPISGYLTAGTPVSAGYLTQGSSASVHTVPPPVDKEDPLTRPDLI